jgi:hypothetical protein
MMKRLCKIRLGGDMASITKLWLILDQQVLLFFRMMRRMAINATNIAVSVSRLSEMRLLMPVPVTGETAGAGFLPRMILKNVYFGFVAAARHMIRAGTMATFATLM